MIVIKRDGSQQAFDINKILKAVEKAYKSQNKDITSDVKYHLESVFEAEDNKVYNVEEIQDLVEKALMSHGVYDVAKAFILYREKHNETRFLQDRLDYMRTYSSSSDNASTSSETDANANVGMKNVATLEGEVYKLTNRRIHRRRMTKKLQELYPEVASQYVKDLENHIIYAQDEASSPCLKAYCMAASLYPLMLEGTGNIDGVTPSAPNDIESFSGQVTNLVFLLSSQVRGAVALGDYFVALNYYVIKEYGTNWYDKLDLGISSEYCTKKKTVATAIRKGMKTFIYGVNQPAGNRSYNSPFSNLNFFDKYYFSALFEEFYYPDGTKPEWKAIDTLQRIFMELLRELRLIKPLTFPVTSLCCLYKDNECLDLETKNWAAEEWAKGSSFFMYLSNNPNSVSSCCRVQNEITDNTFSSTTGLTGIMTGSCNVITLNLNRIIQDCDRDFGLKQHGGWQDNTAFLIKRIQEIVERVQKYHIAYKTMLYDMEKKGMYSCCNAGYIYMKKLYCTIGVIGYCEAAEYLGMTVSNNPEYKKFLKTVFNAIQESNKKHSVQDKKQPFVFNIEAIPGEALAVKFYNWDKQDGYKVPLDQNLFSSYFFKQWDKNISVLDKLKLHGKEVSSALSGGQASHIHLKEHLSKEQYLKLINVAMVCGCNYFTFNIPMSECKDCGHVVNAPITECPKCKSKNIDWWIRIIGFLRPLSNYSKDRYIEAKKRILTKKEDVEIH